MERDRTLGHQEPQWKEFRFDLTQIPAGEAVTAAEFRIYKLPSTHLLNWTLHVSMFEVVLEQSNRCLPCAPRAHSSLCRRVQPNPGCRGEHFPEDRRGASWAAHPQRRKMVGPRPRVTVGRGPASVLDSSPHPTVLAVGHGQVTEHLSLSFRICTWAQ